MRGVGVAMAMQGSSIAGVDVGGASVKLNEDGSYTLSLGATYMGTGCDTVLSQMAADTLMTDYDNIVVFGVDTDISPYDSGSYASATTYIAGDVYKRQGQLSVSCFLFPFVSGARSPCIMMTGKCAGLQNNYDAGTTDILT